MMSRGTFPRTTTALLRGLESPTNELAWRELVERVEPIMRGVAARMGVPASDIGDMVQTALMSFLEAWRRGDYDRSRGRLSSFLVTILRSRVIEYLRRANRPVEALHDGQEAGQDTCPPVESQVEQFWMDERQKRILALAIEALRQEGMDDRTLQAFELYALRGSDAAMVATQLGMTRNDVYNAKYRVARRLQPIVARLDEVYEDL